MQRALLARIISGPSGQPLDLEIAQGEDLFTLARAEGVVGLVSQRLGEDATIPVVICNVFSALARGSAAAHLALEAEARRVLAVLYQAGIPVLVLKGLALGQWLFSAPYLRESSDIDLLFATRADAERAAVALMPHGYVVPFSPGDMAHEFLCRRVTPGRKVDLDLHWRLANMPLLRNLFSFDELLAASIALPRLASGARGLGPLHAFVNACLHRVENLGAGLGDRLKWLYDLHLLAGRFSAADWDGLQGLCIERGLCGICAEGIDTASALFGTSVPVSVREALRAGRARESLDATRLADWKYMQRRNLAALPSLRARGRWVWQRTFPSIGYLRELYNVDGGPLALWVTRTKRALDRLKT